ncbi:hypothetical protein ACFY3U_07760 [Micromonospora sp. NPDC000089]|uniref:hypothetical protein n=1 Tax=unclassified Micromonospora TaxID=2617518 RepID=UPI00367CB91C
MDEMSAQMRVATAAAPPTRIDVDVLISAERRRRRHRLRAVSGTGLGAAVAAVLVTPALFGGSPAPVAVAPPPLSPSGTGGPSSGAPLCAVPAPKASGPPAPLQTYDTVRARPTEAPGAGVPRLTAALRQALVDQIERGTRVTGVQPGCAGPQFDYQDRYREYETVLELRSASGRGHLVVSLRPTPAGSRPDCAHAPDPNCKVRRAADGSVLLTATTTEPGGATYRWAQVRRPDGTSVEVKTDNFFILKDGRPEVTAAAPLLTLDQVVAIAGWPALTLYP